MRTGTETKVELFLIRHGKTKANLEHRYLGKTDEGLCRQGRIELEEKRKQMPQIDLLFSGPMKRCLESSRILFPDQNPIIIREWTEMDFGEFEYKNYRELSANDAYQKWIDEGGIGAFPKGESREEFIKRCLSGLEEFKKKMRIYCTEKGKQTVQTAALVHGGTIMALMSSCRGADYFDYQTECGSGYTLSFKL